MSTRGSLLKVCDQLLSGLYEIWAILRVVQTAGERLSLCNTLKLSLLRCMYTNSGMHQHKTIAQLFGDSYNISNLLNNNPVVIQQVA